MVLAATASFSGYSAGTPIWSARKSLKRNCLPINRNSCKMQIMANLTPELIQEPTAQEFLLIRPLSYILEICGWAQARAAHLEDLGPLHVTFLRRAAWKGMVSFDRIHRETGIPRYAISRAAALLEQRRFGKVKPDKEDKRWKRLQITLLGLKCCDRIDSVTSQFLIMQFRKRDGIFREDDVFPHYNFALSIDKAARCLPDPFRILGPWAFPDPVTRRSTLNAQQKELIRFLKDRQRAAELLESRMRSSPKAKTK